MDQRIIELYDEYTHKPLNRQDFIRRLVLLTGSLATAIAILPSLEGNYANATITDDEELFTEYISFAGTGTTVMKAYVARPKKETRYSAVMVIHENRGLNPHIEDVARRVARAGYLAMAPNALAPLGGTPDNEDEARQLFSKLDQKETQQNFMKGFDYLATRKDQNRNYGCVGFCWGGAMANHLAVHIPKLRAAVSYYGRQPSAEDVKKIKAAVQLHYGGLDTRINEGMKAYEEALKENNITYEQYVYEGVNHAFHNDTSSSRYNEAAARLSWQRTLDFFSKHLK